MAIPRAPPSSPGCRHPNSGTSTTIVVCGLTDDVDLGLANPNGLDEVKSQTQHQGP
ncbi:MAG: hypothetical protein U0556_04900 [Dehalococcoidia bacterium]